MKKLIFIFLAFVLNNGFSQTVTADLSGTILNLYFNFPSSSSCIYPTNPSYPNSIVATTIRIGPSINFTVGNSQLVSSYQTLYSINNQTYTHYVSIDIGNTYVPCNAKVEVGYSCNGNANNSNLFHMYSNILKSFYEINPTTTLVNDTICSGTSITNNHVFQTNEPSSVIYSWKATNPGGLGGASTTFQQGNTITDVLTINDGSSYNVNYTIKASLNGSNDQSCILTKTKTIRVIGLPIQPTISLSLGTSTFCEGDQVYAVCTPQNSGNAISNWYVNSILLPPDASPFHQQITNTGNYYMSFSNQCGVKSSNTINAIMHPKPILTSPTNLEICTGENTNYLLVANEPSNFTWTANSANISGETNSGSGNSINDLLTNNTSSNQSIAYHINLVSQLSGCTKNQNVIIQVKPTPILSSISNTSICSGDALNIPLSSNVATSTYSWIAQNNTNVSGESTVLSNSSTITDTLINNTSTDIPVDYAVNAITECGTSPTEYFTITVRASPQPIILASGPLEFCDGDFVNLSVDQIYSHYSWSNGLSGPNITTISIEQTEDVNVNVIDQYGCTGSSSIVQVIEHPIPAPIINYSNGVLSSNYSTGNQWKLNNQPILGANQNTYSPITNGNYSLTVTIDGCSGNSSSVYFGSASLSENNPNPFTIHPNPATNQVIISSQFFIENEAVQIFNTAGQLVLEYPNLSPHHQTYTINVEQLNPGIYFIQLGEMTQKLIIE